MMHQDFSHQNLCGRSFQGQNLAGANFSQADIRSTNFTNAILTGANFSQAIAGQRYTWVIGLMFGSLTLAAFAGFILAYAGGLVGVVLFWQQKYEFLLAGIIFLIVLAVFALITVRQGLGAALGGFIVTIMAITALVVAAVGRDPAVAAILQSLSISVAIAGTVLEALALSTIWATTGLPVVLVSITVALVAAVPGLLIAAELEKSKGNSGLLALSVGGTITLMLLGLSLYIAWRVQLGDPKYPLLRGLSTFLSSIGGTSFHGANLSESTFNQATLKSVDFRKALLKRTSWFQASKLEQARIQGTYLIDSRVRHLVTTRDGREKNYDRLDLRGLNLKDAKLQDGSFIGADLNEATLEAANLSGAKLVQTQLYKTNLTGACLTGAYIQDWGISTDTKLEAVKCEYIYMQLPTKDDPDPYRKPDDRNETFKEGDFTEFITPIIKTLDLYRAQNLDLRKYASTFKTLDLFHYEGLDPAAASVAFGQLSEEYPEAELEVVALEGRGNEKVRLQAVVAGNVNRSELSAKYFAKYEQIQALPYGDLQALMAGVVEKDERIRNLEKLLESALQQPKFYVETYQNQGEFIMTQSKGNVNISGVQGNVSGVAAAGENQTMTGVAMGVISGSVTNTINQLPASLDPNNPGIKELLAQLQAAIEAEANLPDEDKVEALEQVKTLAEAGQKPEDGILQKAAKTAMKILKGTVASLPDAAKLAEASVKLLPLISGLLLLV